ncbi:wall-associated kinase, putative [Ricinus communis]|uniref:Wall-associated kinase, putative n=1 Tax=Ricinus communis TaxID=3988 RepID=B9SLZ7_RICCO|nr:wall-associated kinase, putative [Ricinus communis]|eukprot:XP_002527016.1 LEAF RUST 10 DISEASE-RESISTANCE LOCUS RECEPTOR-LIKE PROTEIN KINASE-like 1.1 [Ricinus communis]
MEMAAVSLFVFFALFQPVLLQPIEGPNCPRFYCGSLGELVFPYTNITENTECGLFVVNDCDKEHRQIQLERGSGKWYTVERIQFQNPSVSSISIIDTELQKSLDSRNCASFNNLSLPHVPLVNIQIVPSQLITLLKCDPTAKVTSPLIKFNYTGCPNFNIFYTGITREVPIPPTSCSTIQLPANIDNGYEDIFKLLTADFTLQVTLSFEFHFCEQCHLQAGECHGNSTGKLQCLNANGSEIKINWEKEGPEPHKKKKEELAWELAVGLGCPAFLITLALVIFFCRRHNRKMASPNLLRVNTYSGAFSKSDLEGANIYFGVSIFSYAELEEATNNFASENELGDGGFGTVFYGKLQDGREVAVKRLYERNCRKVQQFLNEIEILTRLRHQNLVSLYGFTSRRSRELLLVYEYIPNGTVADHLHGDRVNSSPLTLPIRMRIAIETANALVYLHASGIIHRDVKTNNILLDNNFCVKVADFGISRLFPNDVTHISTAPQGTPGYVDPEYYHCYQLTEKSDVYSFGVVLVELISSMPAVDITRERHEINLANLAINKIQRSAFDELIDPFLGYQSDEEVQRMTVLVAELAFLCLQKDKEMRPAMHEVLEELKRIESGECESDNLENRKHGDV